MRLLFVILAHDRPEDASALARALTEGGTDARALIHFDLRADPALFARVEAAVADAPRVDLVRDRVATAWGEWGLVAAPLNALAQAEAGAADWMPERVILLSGVCLPCRPVRQLERWLSARPGREFIEVRDSSWMVAGLRDERWSLHFPFNFRSQPFLHRWGTRLQRWLGVKRRFPEGLTPRFGSQWWCLTWETCAKLLAWRRENPAHEAFFRRVWIPDEMVIQTLVHKFVPAGRIHGGGLTHFQFTDRGVPVVYFNDHADYVPTLDAFFVRKVSPGAARLRATCLALARAPADAGAPVALDRRSTGDYALKVAAQTLMGGAGRAFRPDQMRPNGLRVLSRGPMRLLVLMGPPEVTAVAAAALDPARFEVFGEVFAPDGVDLGDGREAFRGLTADDAHIRDLHPALYLSRLLDRCERFAVIRWNPLHAPAALDAVLRDRRAVVAVCLPRTGNEARDMTVLNAAFVDPIRRDRAALLADASGDGVAEAIPEALAGHSLGRPLTRWPLASGLSAEAAEGVAARLVPMVWAPPEADGLGPRRAAAFARGLSRLEAGDLPEGSALAEALRAAWARPPFTHPPR